MQNNANEMAVFNTAIYVRLSKEDIVAAQSGRESNSITNLMIQETSHPSSGKR